MAPSYFCLQKHRVFWVSAPLLDPSPPGPLLLADILSRNIPAASTPNPRNINNE